MFSVKKQAVITVFFSCILLPVNMSKVEVFVKYDSYSVICRSKHRQKAFLPQTVRQTVPQTVGPAEKMHIKMSGRTVPKQQGQKLGSDRDVGIAGSCIARLTRL